MVKNSVLISGIYILGDITQQRFISKVPQYDYVNTRNVAIIGGVCLSPLYVTWYKFLDRMWPGNSKRRLIQKVLADQLIAGSTGTCIFFVGMSTLERQDNVFAELRQKGPTAYLCNFLYWPAVMLGIFRRVPVPLQPMAVACGDFVWSIFLCYYKMQGHIERPVINSVSTSAAEEPGSQSSTLVEN